MSAEDRSERPTPDETRAGAVAIRLAEPRDSAQIAEMIRDRARSAGQPTEHVTEAVALRDVCGPTACVSAAVADCGTGRLAGVAVWHPAYEAVYAARGAYVPELYVAPDMRRHGVATSLLAFAARRVREEGGVYLWIIADRSNVAAQRLYRRHSDIEMHDDVSFAITRAAFERLCDGSGEELGARPC